MKRLSLYLYLPVLIFFSACAPFRPKPIAEVGFMQRAKTEKQGKLTVSVVALGPKESEAVFDTKLAKKGIQPVWLRLENLEKEPFWLQPISLDPEYFSPNEAAFRSHSGHSKKAKEEINEFFNKYQIHYYLPPGAINEGYIYTRLSHGAKEVSVQLIGDEELRTFNFVVPVPGLRVDYDYIDYNAIYAPDQYRNVDLMELRQALKDYPCCTSNKKGEDWGGDAVNFVIVGDEEDFFAAFVRRNWNQTEVRYKGSIFKTLKSFLFRSAYDNSPVSDLYLFSRPQDVAFQKPRKSIHFRNHLRMWKTPLHFKGKPVWLGAISRDIGVKASVKGSFFMTHRIDSDVDEARDYLLQDFLASGSLESFGYIGGGKEASQENPRQNFTKDPIYTDGLRLVMFLSDKPVSIMEVNSLNWEYPRER